MNCALPQQNTYNQFADRYAEEYLDTPAKPFNYSRDVVIPALMQMVGDVAGQTVLDAGCGEGIVARLLAGRGATVTGIDVAPRLIELAQERDQSSTITYLVRDLSQPLPAYHQHFDLVVSNLVLTDVPDYQGFVATLANVLKLSGRIVLSMNNPYSALMRNKVENYFDSGAATLYGGMARNGIAVYYFHRTMEEYMTAFQQQGLLLRRLVDVRMSRALVAQFPERDRNFPFIMVLELVSNECNIQ